MLLIVPYGIETSNGLSGASEIPLLIVPYGIETVLYRHGSDWHKCLLIVPYGIETHKAVTFYNPGPFTFNRTLWN